MRVVERQQNIAIQEQEIIRKEKELDSKVLLLLTIVLLLTILTILTIVLLLSLCHSPLPP